MFDLCTVYGHTNISVLLDRVISDVNVGNRKIIGETVDRLHGARNSKELARLASMHSQTALFLQLFI